MITYTDCRLEGGRLIITPSPESLRAAMEMANTSKGKMCLSYKKFREARSLDANAYAWVLMNKLASAIGIPVREVYKNQVRGVPGASQVTVLRETAIPEFCRVWQKNGLAWMVDDLGPSASPGYRNLVIWFGSSTFDRKQMGQMIDNIICDCKALGVETMPPDRLNALLEGWSNE